jgi:hypothetical protein
MEQYMEPIGSLPRSKQRASCPYTKADYSAHSSHPTTHPHSFFRYVLAYHTFLGLAIDCFLQVTHSRQYTLIPTPQERYNSRPGATNI